MAYKMILNNSIVDADLSPCYARYNPKLKMFLECNAENAQFIASRNGDQWWHIAGTSNHGLDVYKTVEVVETDEDEASALMVAFDAKREPIKIELPPDEPDVDETLSDDALTIIREHTVSLMMQHCEAAICAGFDVVLSDGEHHHFSLSQADQLNLISLNSMRSAYPDGIPYQADGEPLCLYSEDDFNLIFNGAAACRAHNYVYSKNLCAYVDTLETFDDLQGVSYGMKIPENRKNIKDKGGRKK